jgi:hypothetical protein
MGFFYPLEYIHFINDPSMNGRSIPIYPWGLATGWPHDCWQWWQRNWPGKKKAPFYNLGNLLDVYG